MNEGYNAREFPKFIGVVEDRMDPLKLRRVRVRCFHIHPADKTLVPTEDLPWARVGTKLTLIEGDHVRGYFEDGPDMQHPVVTEWNPGVPETANEPTLGFNDPRTAAQLATAPRPPASLSFTDTGSGVAIVEQAAAVAGFRLNEPQFPRLMRGENLESYKSMLSVDSLSDYPMGIDSMITGVVNSVLIAAQQKITGAIAGLINKIPGASLFTPTIIRDFFTQPYFKKFTLASKYTFPKSPAAPQYPYNHVRATESGHIQEFDDTPGAERIHTRHRSGTYTEYHPDGDYVNRVVKDKHELIDGSGVTIVRGSKQVVVEGSDGLTVRGARYVEIEGDCKVVILGNAEVSVKGNAKQYINGNFEQVIGGDYTQTVTGKFTRIIGGECKTTFQSTSYEVYGKDWKQDVVGEWTLKMEKQAFRWELFKNPVTTKSINLSSFVLPTIDPDTPDTSALNGAEFTTEPKVTSKALDNLENACKLGDLTNFDVANASFTLVKTIDPTGKSFF